MPRLTRVEYADAKMVKGKIVNTHNVYTNDLTSRHLPMEHLYNELEKLSRYEDICDEPEKLLLCCDMKLLEAINGH